MKKLIIAAIAVYTVSCSNNNQGAKDNKNEVENYPTYDTTQKPGNVNKGGDDNQLSSPDNRDENTSTR